MFFLLDMTIKKNNIRVTIQDQYKRVDRGDTLTYKKLFHKYYKDRK